MGSAGETVPLGYYLWKRIKQVGVSRILGCPGDFNLTLLDHLYDVEGLEWVGSTNELNAAYAADGYARVKDGAGCLVTTHGVGELSALNGIAGSMTEQVKVIHVVGQTSRRMQQDRMMIHHSIGSSPDHQIFNHASKGFRCAAAELQSEQGAPEEIDRVLRECFVQSLPVYIFVPIDIVDLPVPAQPLETPIDLEPERDETQVQAAARACLAALYEAKCPCVLVDCLVQRHGGVKGLRSLVDKLGFPTYSTNMAKGLIDETYRNYVSVYNGLPSDPGVKTAFEASDVILLVGSLPSDTNSGGFTRLTPSVKTISLDPFSVSVRDKQSFSKCPIKLVLASMNAQLDAQSLPSVAMPTLPPRLKEDDLDSDLITQSWLWHRIASFLQPHDVVYGETGTAAFGIPDARFPCGDIHWITQTYYGSIGYATPSAFGSELALAELASAPSPSSPNQTPPQPRGRTILLTGDGSLMLTLQELGNMIKHSARPVIFIVNNKGYTIERVIHGAHKSYNDIVPFNYAHLLPLFATRPDRAARNFHRAHTKAELETILTKDELRSPPALQIVELVLDMMDVPWRLSAQVATRGPVAVAEMREAGFKVRVLQEDSATGFWEAK